MAYLSMVPNLLKNWEIAIVMASMDDGILVCFTNINWDIKI